MTGARAIAVVLIAACGPSPAPAPRPAPTPAADSPDEPATPRRSAELDRLFGQALAHWVVALNQPDAAADAAELRRAASDLLPAEVVVALDAALDAARAARDAPEPEVDAASDRLDDAVAELDRQLSAARLGYVIDASVVTRGEDRSVLLFSFTVDRVRRYRGDRQTYRALWVSRLDRLAYRYRLVGIAAQRRDVLILAARIDEWLVRDVLPTLADAGAWRERHPAAGVELGAAVTAALERELGGVAGAGLAELAAALEARRALFADIAGRLAERGVTVERPATLALDDDWRAALEGGLTASERERLDAIEKRLADVEVQIAYNKVRELAIAAVEHHEIQHQIDAPTDLGPGPHVDHLGPEAGRVATRETSAYLAQIGRHPKSARLSVVKLAGFALAPRTPPVERMISGEIIAALASELGAAPDNTSPEEIAVATAALLSRDGPELASAAAAIWKQRFGNDLAPLAPE